MSHHHDQSCGQESCHTAQPSSCHQGSCQCPCHKCTCCSGASHEGKCEKAEMLLNIADMAWMEVLKEKIKEHILASDHKISEMAKIVAETNRERWHQKMAGKQLDEQYKERLRNLLCSAPKKK